MPVLFCCTLDCFDIIPLCLTFSCTLLSNQPVPVIRVQPQEKYNLQAEASFLMETFTGLHLFLGRHT